MLNAEKGSQVSKSVGNLDWIEEHLEPMSHCPICSSKNWRLLYQIGVLFVHRCRDCQMMFLNPYLKPEQMSKIFSSPELLKKVSRFFADYYEENTWNTPKTLSIYRDVLKHLAHFLPQRGKLIDIGCGRGAFLKLAQEAGWEAFGVEPNFNDAEELRTRHGIQVFSNNFFEASLPKASFDVVSLWDLIEHVPNPADWIKRCRSVMRSGGLLLIATPNHDSFLDLLASLAYHASGGRFTYAAAKLYTVDHTLYFTQKTLEGFLESQGFEVLKSVKVNTDLSRYSMNPGFRLFSESLLLIAQVLNFENRIITLARIKD